MDNWYQTAIVEYKLNSIPFEEFKKFGKDEIVGKGGFGVVYSTTWTLTSEVVALKRISVDTETSVKDFLKELKLHSSLEHDRIIKFFGVSQDESDVSYHYLVMEFADGGNLRNYLSKKKDTLQWKERIRLSIQIAEGISYLHNEINIVHRDLHTRNILICKGNIKISDFGLSKCLNNNSTSMANEIRGVLPFIDPQKLIRCNYRLDKRSDIYSIGVIFWEISSCHSPYKDFGQNTLILGIISNDLREKHISGTPIHFVQLYSNCWETDPVLRPEIDVVLNRLQIIDDTFTFESSPAKLDSNVSRAHLNGHIFLSVVFL